MPLECQPSSFPRARWRSSKACTACSEVHFSVSIVDRATSMWELYRKPMEIYGNLPSSQNKYNIHFGCRRCTQEMALRIGQDSCHRLGGGSLSWAKIRKADLVKLWPSPVTNTIGKSKKSSKCSKVKTTQTCTRRRSELLPCKSLLYVRPNIRGQCIRSVQKWIKLSLQFVSA